MDMQPGNPRRRTMGIILLGCAIGCAFELFFFISKHNGVLSSKLPYLVDPFDAISTYASLFIALAIPVSVLCGLIGLLALDARRQHFIVIAQRWCLAICSAVLVALSNDLMAVLRDLAGLSLRREAPVEANLVCAVLLALSLGGFLMISLERPISYSGMPRCTVRMTVTMAAATGTFLLLCPRAWIKAPLTHFFIVLLSAGILFGLMRLLLLALGSSPLAPSVDDQRNRKHRSRRWFTLVATTSLISMLIAAIVVHGEAMESHTPGVPGVSPPPLFVGLIYLVFTLGGLLLGLALLARPLGLLSGVDLASDKP